MPIIVSKYKAPYFFRNTHLQTIYAGAIRKVQSLPYETERLDTPDGDFLDIDWLRKGNKKVVIITHGMCGNAHADLVKGIANAMSEVGFDIIAINFRGSGKESNRSFKTYHSGETDDLRMVINTIAARSLYHSISLAGYSLGGNVILKYLGEEGSLLPGVVKNAAVMSVPVDLVGSDLEMKKWKNKHYILNFNFGVRRLLAPKIEQFPDLLHMKHIKKAKNLSDFANVYVAPAFGFKDADDYHTKASSLPYLQHIKVPTLLIQAQDDTILSESCYPYEIAKANPNLFLEITTNGGHVGFVRFAKDRFLWSELRFREFLTIEN
ncbi:MAG: YheT family hydrolase [Saprospiraceae bacterium]